MRTVGNNGGREKVPRCDNGETFASRDIASVSGDQ